MAQTRDIITTLKKALRSQHMTYADVAKGLKMSEANIKRLFASERITLDRIEAICRLMDMDLSDLFQMYEDSRKRIEQLTESQEKELIADTKLLLVAVCVRNHHSFDDILRHYHIDEPELIQKLAKLDRLKIIDLLPNNKIKLRISEHFSWIPNGPIERFYEKAIQNEFLKKGFNTENSPRVFLSGLLSESSQTVIRKKLQALCNEFTQLHRQDSELPLEKRHNIGILIAMREWEFSELRPFVKKPLNES